MIIAKLTFILLTLSSIAHAISNENLSPDNRLNKNLEETLKTNQFLDSTYQLGRISFSDGTYFEGPLNYHLLSNKISLIDDDKIERVLNDLSEVVIIIYGDRTFLPTNNHEVAEVIATFKDNTRLLLRRHSKTKYTQDYSGAYGGSTVTTSQTHLSSIDVGGTYVWLDTSKEIEFVIHHSHIILKNNKRHTINRLRALRRVYPSKWADIKEFAQENDINVKNTQDLISLLNFCAK